MAEIKENPGDPEPGDPHNSFFYIAVSYGIVGLACFFWLLAMYFRKGWRHRNTVAGYSMLAFGLVLLTGSLTGTQINSLATGYLFALFMGLPAESNH
jgi:O-antigen ligase